MTDIKKRKAHFGNIFFEIDLEGKFNSIQEAIHSHPNFIQLQYLPTLYQKEDDVTLVTHLTEKPQDHIKLITDPLDQDIVAIEPWGISESLINDLGHYGKLEHLSSIELIKTLSSKLWSFKFLKNYLKTAHIFTEKKEIEEFLKVGPYPLVLKTPNGFSGRGHLILKDPENEKQKTDLWLSENFHGALIVEPWLNRTLDFSTQWLIEENAISCLGATLLINNLRGSYIGTQVFSNDPFLLKSKPQIEEHYLLAKLLTQEIKNLGFRGNLGIDAFFYMENGKEKLLPIVEINPRKTMGYVALEFSKKIKTEKNIYFRFSDNKTSLQPLLPKELKIGNQLVRFKKNLFFEYFD